MFATTSRRAPYRSELLQQRRSKQVASVRRQTANRAVAPRRTCAAAENSAYHARHTRALQTRRWRAPRRHVPQGFSEKRPPAWRGRREECRHDVRGRRQWSYAQAMHGGGGGTGSVAQLRSCARGARQAQGAQRAAARPPRRLPRSAPPAREAACQRSRPPMMKMSPPFVCPRELPPSFFSLLLRERGKYICEQEKRKRFRRRPKESVRNGSAARQVVAWRKNFGGGRSAGAPQVRESTRAPTQRHAQRKPPAQTRRQPATVAPPARLRCRSRVPRKSGWQDCRAGGARSPASVFHARTKRQDARTRALPRVATPGVRSAKQ